MGLSHGAFIIRYNRIIWQQHACLWKIDASISVYPYGNQQRSAILLFGNTGESLRLLWGSHKMCELLISSLWVTVYFRKIWWWNTNGNHNKGNKIQWNGADLRFLLILTDQWCCTLQLSPTGTGDGLQGVCPLGCAVLIYYSDCAAPACDSATKDVSSDSCRPGWGVEGLRVGFGHFQQRHEVVTVAFWSSYVSEGWSCGLQSAPPPFPWC